MRAMSVYSNEEWYVNAIFDFIRTSTHFHKGEFWTFSTESPHSRHSLFKKAVIQIRSENGRNNLGPG
jgi:hypothetical protein